MIHSGADDLLLWLTIFDVRYVPRSGSEVLNKNVSYWQRMLTRSMLDLFRYRIQAHERIVRQADLENKVLSLFYGLAYQTF